MREAGTLRDHEVELHRTIQTSPDPLSISIEICIGTVKTLTGKDVNVEEIR